MTRTASLIFAAGFLLAGFGAQAAVDGNAGVCLKLNDTGRVLEGRITESSGNAEADLAIMELASQLHWDKPYPKPGWMPIRLGVGASAQSDRAAPPCDPAQS
ncbi:MAG TPA: hypothetical protein VGG48_19330 [Rhizomicrobium sp.]